MRTVHHLPPPWQTVEAACVAGGGTLDTHVLMSLAVFGTLALGMAQEVSTALNLGGGLSRKALNGSDESTSPLFT